MLRSKSLLDLHLLKSLKLVLALVISFLLPSVCFAADPLSEQEWNAYFSPRKEAVSYRVTMSAPGRSDSWSLVEKYKGEKELNGKTYHHYVVIQDKGPYAGKPLELLSIVDTRGLVEIQKGKEVLLIPRSLAPGQTWTIDNETLTFEGFSDYDTASTTVKDCLKILTKDKGGEGVKYYERSKGLIFRSGDHGSVTVSKVRTEYVPIESK